MTVWLGEPYPGFFQNAEKNQQVEFLNQWAAKNPDVVALSQEDASKIECLKSESMEAAMDCLKREIDASILVPIQHQYSMEWKSDEYNTVPVELTVESPSFVLSPNLCEIAPTHEAVLSMDNTGIRLGDDPFVTESRVREMLSMLVHDMMNDNLSAYVDEELEGDELTENPEVVVELRAEVESLKSTLSELRVILGAQYGSDICEVAEDLMDLLSKYVHAEDNAKEAKMAMKVEDPISAYERAKKATA